MQDYRNLAVWRKSHEVTLAVYKAASMFPREELHSLTSQVRRAASSIPARIAEGCELGGGKRFVRHIRIAVGSACKLEYHLLLARDLHLLGESEHAALASQVTTVKKMLTSLIARLIADSREPSCLPTNGNNYSGCSKGL
jgi:four helix bundle protein